MTSVLIEGEQPVHPDVELPETDYNILRKMVPGAYGMMHTDGSGPGENIVFDRSAAHVRFGDGTVMDVVPAGFRKTDLSRMLHAVFGLDYRAGSGEDMFEFLVMLVIRDVNDLLRKGMKFAYSTVQRNETTFKGRLLFSENIRENLVHKERVFVEYELFSSDRPENRLIKSTLEILSKRTTGSRNRRDIKVLLTELEEIPSSKDVFRDLEKVNLDRNMIDYISVVKWCEVFLNALGVAGSSRGGTSFAVMTRFSALAEAYVAKMSSFGRMDGSFSPRCEVNMSSDCGEGAAVICVDVKWFYYDRRTKSQMRDAERLFETAPGYKAIPPVGVESKLSRTDRMAMCLLAESA